MKEQPTHLIKDSSASTFYIKKCASEHNDLC